MMMIIIYLLTRIAGSES